MSDIVAKLVMDVQDWIEPIMDAKAHLVDIEGVTKKSVNTIRQQFAGLASAKSFLAGKLQQIDNGEAPYKVVLGSIRDINRAWGSDTPAAINRAVTANSNVAQSMAGVAQSNDKTKSSIMDLAEGVGKKAVIAWMIYKVVGEDIIASGQKHLATNSDLRKSLGGQTGSVMGLAGELSGALGSGLKIAFNGLLGLGTGANDIGEIFDAGAKTITSWANTGTAAVKGLKDGVRDASLIFATAFIHVREGEAAGDQFHEQGVQLRQMADATANVTAKQEQMKSVMDFIKTSAKAAGEAQAHSAEVAKIGTIENLDALEQAEVAFKERNKSVSAEIANSKEWQQYINQVNGALAKQKTAIETGTVKKQENPVDKQIAEAQQSLKKASLSETEFAIATAVANGATAQQVNTLRAALDAKQQLTAANEAQAAAERATADAAQHADDQYRAGKDRIESLRDQIDLLNGTASQADITMRELFRQGFDNDQIGEIGDLTAELEKLRDADKKPGGSSGRQGRNQAALEGTSQAAELVVRGTTGSGRQDAEQKKTNGLMGQLIKATKDNKPPDPPPVVAF